MLKISFLIFLIFLNACTLQKPERLQINLSSTIQPPVLKPMSYVENDKCFLLKNSRQPVVCQTIENAKNTLENINVLRQSFNEAVEKLKIIEAQYNK